MFRWFGLIGLRMKTISVIEREYRRRLEVAGGPDSELFNKTTRLAQDFGGNEYDAAAVFMIADAATRLREDADADIRLGDQLQITTARMPLMRRPPVVEEAIERTLATAGR